MNSVVYNPTGPRALATTAFLLIVTIGVSLTALDRPVATFVHQAFASPILFRLASVFFSALLIAGGLLAAPALWVGWTVVRGEPVRLDGLWAARPDAARDGEASW